MRLIVGLDAPTDGEVTVNGRRYADFQAPLHEVGLLLDTRSVHGGRSAYNHLLALAHTHGSGPARVERLIELVWLADVAHKRAGGFSLGMGQRLGIAAALLADPARGASMSRSTGSTPRGSAGPVTSSSASPPRGSPCSCPRT
jgi:ABC-2 type transport system ATP-binding protein